MSETRGVLYKRKVGEWHVLVEDARLLWSNPMGTVHDDHLYKAALVIAKNWPLEIDYQRNEWPMPETPVTTILAAFSDPNEAISFAAKIQSEDAIATLGVGIR